MIELIKLSFLFFSFSIFLSNSSIANTIFIFLLCLEVEINKKYFKL